MSKESLIEWQYTSRDTFVCVFFLEKDVVRSYTNGEVKSLELIVIAGWGTQAG
jgi:hypothetical protein